MNTQLRFIKLLLLLSIIRQFIVNRAIFSSIFFEPPYTQLIFRE